jgi:ribosomal protein S19E (S16A)
MVILDKILKRPGIGVDKILDEFSKEQIEGIYPALSQIMVQVLIEELELMGYLEIHDGRAVVSKMGEAKLEGFTRSISPEEREALGLRVK